MNAGRLAVVLSLLLWLAWACAPGSDTIGGGAGATSAASTSDSTDDGAPSTSPSSSTSAGGAAGNGGAGGCDLMSPNTCETAEALPEIDGDQGTDMAMIKGTGSKWFQIKVVEASNAPARVSYTATLTSAMGTNYDLYVRHGDESGPDCSFAPLQATGMPEALTQFFPDQTLGEDDSVVLSLEIVHVSGGTCEESAQWTLTVQGNTSPG